MVRSSSGIRISLFDLFSSSKRSDKSNHIGSLNVPGPNWKQYKKEGIVA